MGEQISGFFRICVRAFKLLKRTEPLILSSSTAFFTTFALSPILILLVSIFGLYSKSDRIRNQMFNKIASTIGHEAAVDIEKIVDNFMNVETTWYMTVGVLIFFVFVSTTLLGVVKQNIHKLWRIKRKIPKIRYQLKERAELAAIILLTGVLFLFSVVIDSGLAISVDYLQSVIPAFGIFIVRFFNLVFSAVVVTAWFMMIFKILPNAKVDWDVAFSGGFMTAVLYMFGRYVLAKVLIHARIATIFGASASFALLLLFIFYCSFILYFGAAFTHEYAEQENKHICANKHAQEYEEKLIGSNI
jgi:membrane protein